MFIRENDEQSLKRWNDLELLQEHYREFEWFLEDVMTDFMGFKCSDIQQDIADWIANGPQYRMVQAQRGQAKTTITACYAVWRIIHNPATRILIISAGSDMATEVAGWIIQIINGMDVLECLRPDRAAGDRSSVTGFDVHYTLKGPEKSASVTCIGITSNMQGKRADVLIADDIESSKNGQTAVQRARLHHLTLDFTSINSNGDIIWLGTPQSIDSLYNGLPSRGTSIRVWPGRYPTAKELPDYEGFLAPLILQRIKDNPGLQTGGGPTGDRGQAIDPVILGEAALTKKEIDQGPAYFQLQHMLSTKLSDQDRFPLKLPLVRFHAFNREAKLAPMTMGFIRTDQNLIQFPQGHTLKEKMYRVQNADDLAMFKGPFMYVDPAGGGKNADETAYAVTGYLAGRVYALEVGGIPGGITEALLQQLTDVAVKWKVEAIGIEKNFGNGALRQVWEPLLVKEHRCGIEDLWESGQKELRIIDILEPVIAAGKMVIHEDIITEDWIMCQKYAGDVRQTYSLFFQLARITREKGALVHDDRLDALAGAVRHWVEALGVDEMKAKLAASRENYNRMVKDPLGEGRPMKGFPMQPHGIPSMLKKHGLGMIGHFKRR